jgi:hypothetical protein
MKPETSFADSAPAHEDGLEWLREVRRQLAAEANYDPAEMGRRIREREKSLGHRMFKTRRVLVPAIAGEVAKVTGD